jgi:hypothetical protein
MIMVHFANQETGIVEKAIGINTDKNYPAAIQILDTAFTASTEFQPITRADFIEAMPDDMRELAFFALEFLKEAAK